MSPALRYGLAIAVLVAGTASAFQFRTDAESIPPAPRASNAPATAPSVSEDPGGPSDMPTAAPEPRRPTNRPPRAGDIVPASGNLDPEPASPHAEPRHPAPDKNKPPRPEPPTYRLDIEPIQPSEHANMIPARRPENVGAPGTERRVISARKSPDSHGAYRRDTLKE